MGKYIYALESFPEVYQKGSLVITRFDAHSLYDLWNVIEVSMRIPISDEVEMVAPDAKNQTLFLLLRGN